MISDILGKTLDERYQILTLHGVGGMANVYKATDLEAGRFVAVKILRDEYLDNPELVRRFKNESKAISLLDHDNIVKVFDVSVSDDVQYIVMEFIEGMPLSEYIEKCDGKLTYKVAVYFAEQILSALSHAHEKGVVHRDIKPQNIMLMEDGKVKVMDFGIARLSRSDSRTITEKAIGSVHYISPEQAKGDVTDPKADIYSVGIMLYEMLTGILPFEADSAVSVAIKQISDTAIKPRDVEPSIPEPLEEIILKAMAKEPQNRYQSAPSMLADLAEFKRNPSIKFEYTYLNDYEQTKFIDKVTTRKVERPNPTAKENIVAAKKKPKKKSSVLLPVMLGLATAFAVGCAALVYLIFNMSGSPLFVSFDDVELPNFVGQSSEDLRSEYSFRFLVEEVYSNEYPVGTVVNQVPKPPKTVKENAQITLQVSKGVEIVTLPELYGMKKADAEVALRDLGLSVTTEYIVDESETVPFGYVISSEPSVGTELSSGSTVTLFVSSVSLSNETTVPQITGLSQGDAATLLSDAFLFIGNVTNVESTQTPGTIVSQEPEAGSTTVMNTSVNIEIAIAPIVVAPTPTPVPTITIPNIVGMTVAEAQAANPTLQLQHNPATDIPGGTAGVIGIQVPGPGLHTDAVVTFGVFTGQVVTQPTEPPVEQPTDPPVEQPTEPTQ